MKNNKTDSGYPEIENSKEFIESLSNTENIDYNSDIDSLIYKLNSLYRYSFPICLLLGLSYSFIKYYEIGFLSIIYLLSFLFFSWIIKVFTLSSLELIHFKNTFNK
ncbi:MAG: hypothetical protein E7212_05110 [Clostridium sartagoforme]|nr:hypothetical protein [Clostridium sartagoforme]